MFWVGRQNRVGPHKPEYSYSSKEEDRCNDLKTVVPTFM